MNARGRTVGRVLMVLGVVGLSAVAWRRLLRRDGDDLPVPVSVAIELAVVAAVFVGGWWRGRRAAGGQVAIAAQRPGWRLHQVWADATLGEQLVGQGVWEQGMNPTGGTRLTLAWSPLGVELWRGGRPPRAVLTLAWDAVASVNEGVGHAASSARPAVVITTAVGARLVLVPAAKPDGALLPAPRPVTAALVAEVRAARDQADQHPAPR